MKKIFPLVTILFAILFFSCSSSVEETREEEVTDEEETYIFDEIPESETGNEIAEKEIYYVIQVGAFTTKQSAEDFAAESERKLGKKFLVSYSGDVNLFVVRLDTKFKAKSDAEAVRDAFRENEEFKDTWIVSLNR